MTLTITPSGQSCGARVTGVDLTRPLAPDRVAEIRAAWLDHHVLAFPDQKMDDDDLERFTQYFGGFGDDPFIKPVPGREHVIAVKRRADETSPLFAENWHSDWSFQARPPAGTCLFGITIPPVGGNTDFSNQHAALDAMPDALRAKIEGRSAVHSARGGYAPSGMYGAGDKDRSMDIRSGEEAMATQLHPFGQGGDAETGCPRLQGGPGHRQGAVAVGVGLDHGHQLGGRSDVALQGAHVGLDGRRVHLHPGPLPRRLGLLRRAGGGERGAGHGRRCRGWTMEFMGIPLACRVSSGLEWATYSF